MYFFFDWTLPPTTLCVVKVGLLTALGAGFLITAGLQLLLWKAADAGVSLAARAVAVAAFVWATTKWRD